MIDIENYFSVQIFFIILRETIEAGIIVSVLLAFLRQNFTDPVKGTLNVDPKLFRSMQMQVWAGAFAGFGICLLIGALFIGTFYIIGTDLWSYTERIWEGMFSILSSIIIAVMGVSLLRINAMKNKWTASLIKSFKAHQHSTPAAINIDDATTDPHSQSMREKYFLAFLPFITTLREGLEAVVFVGGIGVNQPVSSFPLAIIAGAAIGVSVGYMLYRGGNQMSIQYFLIGSTCFLYLVASGLMSRGVWFFELERFVQKCGQDTSETGSGPGSYDIADTVWHVNCCNGLTDGGWMIFNALLGWTNTATYGSVTSYIIFWLVTIGYIRYKSHMEREGMLDMLPVKFQLKKMRKRILVDELFVTEVEEMRLGNDGVREEAGETVDIADSESYRDDTTPLL
ncbi:hypothetical protein CANINC_005031 [Pichia inconspicua]|uniref:Iron permease FTR1 n=1 Tax=Pichia inconspicua TaxID=52247 RepID=A0A4T0WUI8_9ASCO|nr:hypothetical protein CANINC_005031 [[Candida] inconspicua]